jgi:hypothetical protein
MLSNKILSILLTHLVLARGKVLDKTMPPIETFATYATRTLLHWAQVFLGAVFFVLVTGKVA